MPNTILISYHCPHCGEPQESHDIPPTRSSLAVALEPRAIIRHCAECNKSFVVEYRPYIVAASYTINK